MKTDKMKIAHKTESLVNESSSAETPAAVSNLYDVLESLPKPETSMKLTASQKRWWYWFGYEFVKTNQFSKVDLIFLQDAAFAMDMKCKLIALINQENKKSASGVGGVVQKFASGATNITGYQSALKDQIKILNEISAHFGLSIKDRKKLGATTSVSDNQLSLFEQMKEMIHG